MKLVSHNISSPRRSKALPLTARMRKPYEQRSVSRSAARALDLLEYMAREQRPLRAKEIAGALGMHGSTALQMLKTLVDAGHLVFDASAKTYVPSHRLVDFGLWVADGYFGDGRVAALLQKLSDRSGEYVALFTQNDVWMQIIDARVPAEVEVPVEIGTRMPLFGSASGAALLAAWEDSEIARWMDRARLPRGDWDDMRAGIALVRHEGYAFGGVSEGNDARGFAMLLPRSPLGPSLVVGLGGSSDRLESDRAEIVALMRATIWEAWNGAG
ncbi:IclR family transcriptional regulator [Sphingobium tyrosinilyticum]|uniref:IclR family transcriptional regulator n=1 Tax=Sphingobium tyrosinilyticum TaxID=2715436 RepID=A0ABV9F6T2_9SPHN